MSILARINKWVLIVGGVLVVIIAALGAEQFLTLRQAHSSFENYYAFRGCAQLLQRTPSYGVCKTNAGETIKIVEFRGKWYLNNDLPMCIGGVCF